MNVREFFRKVWRFSKYAVWVKNSDVLKDFLGGAWIELREGLAKLREEGIYVVIVNSSDLLNL